MTINTIIFDFGGVLIEWNPRNLYRRFFEHPAEMETFLAEIDFPAWNLHQDAGRPFVVGVAELSARFPQHARLIQAYQEHWEESVGLPIQGSIRLLRRLKSRGYPVYGLSNWSAETFPLIRSRYDFFDLLDGYVISGDVGTVKPDPEIFLALLRRIGRPADECLFIDDSAVNIRAASELGFNSILFESPEQLEARLQHLGIL
ncbi:MAG TPA: HAD family phosphatase [Anaerolineales bacterium]